MNHLERLALAALTHDLRALIGDAQEAQRVFDLARLDDPALSAVLQQAQEYAAPRSAKLEQLTSASLLSIFSLLQIKHLQPPQPHYHRFAPLLSTTEAQTGLFPTPEMDSSGRVAHLQKLASELHWLGAHVDLARFDRAYPH